MQCFSLCAFYAGIANFLTGYNAGGVSMTYNGFSKAVTAALLFKASASFDRAVTAPGCNMASLLSAIGPEGLTKLWHQLTVFAWTVALSQVMLTVHLRLPAVCPSAESQLSPVFWLSAIVITQTSECCSVCLLSLGVLSMCCPQSLHLVSAKSSQYDPCFVSAPENFHSDMCEFHLAGRHLKYAQNVNSATSCRLEGDDVSCIC